MHESVEIGALLGTSTLTSPSSVKLGWNGLAVERRIIHPAEKPELRIDDHFLILWDAHAAEGEIETKSGTFVRYRKLPNTITTCRPGIRPAVRSAMAHRAVICAIAPRFIHDVELELDPRPIGPIQELYGTDDAVLRDLMIRLAREAATGGTAGSLFAESLSTALATRLLHAARALPPPSIDRTHRLRAQVLRRVLERMEAELDSDLSLVTLAGESGYSRTHFLRMFRGATGATPHRFLLELRLKRAQSMVARRELPLCDIAGACGFSSHAHFSTAFRARFGVAPSAYRRGLFERGTFLKAERSAGRMDRPRR